MSFVIGCQQAVWRALASEKYGGGEALQKVIAYHNKFGFEKWQGPHTDGRNTNAQGLFIRKAPVCFVLVPLSGKKRTLDVWIVEYKRVGGSRWVAVGWHVAIAHRGILARYPDGHICPSNPSTYFVNHGWRVRYLEVDIKVGQCALVDGDTLHAGHLGGYEPCQALHISNETA